MSDSLPKSDNIQKVIALEDFSKMKVKDAGEESVVSVAVDSELVEDLYIDEQEEKALVKKLDFRLLPMLAFMYFLSSLDRSNIGNAYTSGMKEDLNLTSRQYSNCVSVFYSTYLAAELPAVLVLKRANVKYYMSFLVFSWSIITLSSGFVRSHKSLLALRVLLGTFEGGFFPAMTLIISIVYKPQEQAKRIAFFFGSAALSGAFGGLIATGLSSVKNGGGLEGWRWLYIIEGLISVCASVWLFFGLPAKFEVLPFLNERECHLMSIRSKQRTQYMGSTEKFSWSCVKDAFLDFKTYLSRYNFCQDTIMYGFSTFLLPFSKLGLGFPPCRPSTWVYLCTSCWCRVLISAFLSDWFKMRGPIFFFYNLLGIVGYILLLSVGNDAVKYFACYLITFSLYTGTGLNISWLTNNMAPHYKRATALGLNQTLGNLSGAIAGQIYTKSPYTFGNSFSLGCIVLSNILTLCQVIILKRINIKRKKILNGEISDNMKNRRGDWALDYEYCL
ncbi:ANM_HP_G0151050.mRNA.1.CDS.1 [Saccharomyces cerevisiae]|nr:ANM_HP_G0151050.mRNA.1.CDS.1 [Saccharomyces cerevisiae]CAI6847661.1 ANM_HP_G0151050.mRNA.1.CDS.1 [Saccharomyces cerevisiae]